MAKKELFDFEHVEKNAGIYHPEKYAARYPDEIWALISDGRGGLKMTVWHRKRPNESLIFLYKNMANIKLGIWHKHLFIRVGEFSDVFI